MADIIISRIAECRDIGMVFPEDPDIHGWGLNRPFAESLAQRLNLGPLPEYFNFPAGTMFWADVSSLEPLFDLNLTWSDYPEEPLPYDGTVLHAIGRMFQA
jgi:lipopolysaccharide biosynthesis protein